MLANINGFNITAFASQDSFVDYFINEKKIAIAMNAEKILKKNDKEFLMLVNRNFSYPDGIGAVLALKQKGVFAIKLPGVELWYRVIEKCYNSKSFYLIGSTDLVISSTIEKLKSNFKGINILGYRDGYVKNEEDLKLIKNEICSLKPEIVFVAMGSPKQEFFMEQLQKVHSASYMGLGGSFDVYSGLKKRAPKLFIYMGLEWFYRFIKEPLRIKRYIKLFDFFYLLFRKKL